MHQKNTFMNPKVVAMIFLTDDIDLITKKQYSKCLLIWTSLQVS